MNILLTNDDGIQAEGLQVLHHTLLEHGHQVEVAAPDRERSAASQSLTITRPLRVRTLDTGIHSIDGTPADCVHLGVLNLVQQRPDMVLSGINWGLNVGDNIYYSGTVAAAAEALHLGLPALAVSRDRWDRGDCNLAAAARFTVLLAEWWNDRSPWNSRCVLNVNFPLGPVVNARYTVQGTRTTHTPAKFDTDPMGRSYFWGWSNEDGLLPDPDADFQAVAEGQVSLTPLKIERTHREALDGLGETPVPRPGDGETDDDC